MKNKGALSRAFTRAAGRAVSRAQYIIANYPSKAVAVTGMAGDILYGCHAVINGNHVGILAATVGAVASGILLKYGDPKITEAEKDLYTDPQDKRNIVNWMFNPAKYPWEHVGLMRMGSLTYMFMGNISMGMQGLQYSYGEMLYSSMAVGGYFIKMGIAEREKGSVPVPENVNILSKAFYRSKAYILENPNPTAGLIWNAGLVPYAVEAIIEGDKFKMASALCYALPNTFTMFSSKRAQVMRPPEKNGP